MNKLFIYIISVLIILSLLGNFWQYKHPKIETRTVVTQLPPEIIEKEIKVTEYIKIRQEIRDTITISTIDTFIIHLRDSLYEGKTLALFDTTKFASGDSIQTKAEFFPNNSIIYNFFPRADTSYYTTETVNSKPWIVLRINANIPLNKEPVFLTSDILFDITSGYRMGPYGTYSIIDGHYNFGIVLSKEWNIKNPLSLLWGR